MLMKKGLIAFDLDGTLIDGFDRFYPGRLEAIEELSRDYYITIASGRSWESIRRFAVLLGINIPYISYDGALLRDVDGRTYFKTTIEERELRFLEVFQRKYNLPFVLFTENHSRIHPMVEEYGTIVSHWRLKYVKDIHFDYEREPIIKVILMRENFQMMRSIFREMIFLRGGVRGIYMYPSRKRKGLWIVDITHPGTNKGVALKKLSEILNVDRVVAVGDYLNDIPMFQVSDISIAVEPSLEEVKRHADFVLQYFRDIVSILL